MANGFSLQTVCGVPRRYQLQCLFCRKTVGVHGIFINMIRCSGKKSECLVSSGRAVHTVHAVFCPCPSKQESVSQPVKASNIGSACAFSDPRARAISWPAETRRKDFPVLMDTHTSISSFRVPAIATARTTTSVSTVRMRIFL